MKHHTHKFYGMGAVILSLALMTGCYPGDVKTTSVEDSVQPEEVLQAEDENLALDISPDEVGTETFTAYNGLVGISRPWNMDTVRKLFADEIQSEKQIEADDVSNWYLFELTNSGFLSCYDGSITYTKSKSLDNLFNAYTLDEMEMKTPSLCKELYTTEALEDFSEAEALEILQTYIDALEIPVCGDPIVYVLDKDGINNMIDRRDMGDWMTKRSGDTSGYRICYSLQAEKMPLVNSSISVNAEKYPTIPAYLKAVVTKDGLVSLDCQNIVEIDRTDAVEFTACSAATALNTVKTNLENGIVNKNTTLENLYFGYALRYKDKGTWDMMPLWTVGEYSETSDIWADVHFVNAETGKEAT